MSSPSSMLRPGPKPILFNGKATEGLNSHYGLDTELLSLVKSAWQTDAPREEEAEASAALAALRDYSTLLVEERIALAMLRGLNRVREIVQGHLGYEPGEVSLRDAALVQWVAAWVAALVVRWAARLSACAVATVALQMGYVTGPGKDARGAAPSADKNPFSIGIDER
jgi:hexokinase